MNHTKPPPLVLIVIAQLFGTSVWFCGSVAIKAMPSGGSPMALGLVSNAVQLGFIVGTLVSWRWRVADRIAAPRLFLWASVGASLSNLAMLLAVPDLVHVLVLRILTGICLAGIYPIGMKIASGWYEAGLGRALAWLVGGLVLGSSLPYLLAATLASMDWQWPVVAASALALCAGMIVRFLVGEGPYAVRAAGTAAADTRVQLKLSAAGYFGHMWELYAFWFFLPVLIGAHVKARAGSINVAGLAFMIVASGAVGCVLGGRLSLTRGSTWVAGTQLLISLACVLMSPLVFGWPTPAFIAFLFVWGVTVVGDSPQFSALTARYAPRERVGSVLSVVTSIGFSITLVSIQLSGWAFAHLPAAFALLPLALGPALGLTATYRLWRIENPAPSTKVA